MRERITPTTLAVLLGAVVVLIGGVGWFGLVASQHKTAGSLDAQVADEQTSLAAAKTPAHSGTTRHKPAKDAGKQLAAQTAALKLAFPSEVGMPSLLLQVQRLATASGVSLESFAPSAETPLSGYESIPIDVTVIGRYRAIQHFVRALRAQAGSAAGHVHATGRLLSVETVAITPAPSGLPDLSAAITVDAFVYTGVVPDTGSDSTTTTENTSGTTTTGGTP
jgi:Tfp pilus assembly protein PilO